MKAFSSNIRNFEGLVPVKDLSDKISPTSYSGQKKFWRSGAYGSKRRHVTLRD